MRLGLAALAGILALACAGPAVASAGWRDTATQGIALNGTALGPLAGSTPMRVAVALSLRNRGALDGAIAAGQRVTPAQFAASYAPAAADAQAVASYLQGAGFTNVAVAPNRLFVTASGTAATASSAFATTLARSLVQGRDVYANATPARVPSNLTGVLSVLGLNDVAMTSPSVTIGVPNYLTSYTPQGFWKAYDATSAATGANTPIAIFAEGDVSGVVRDLRALESHDGLAQVPVSVVTVGPGSSDTSGTDEWDMDTQYSTGMAGTVSGLTIYAATSMSTADLALGFNRFVTDDSSVAGSASFGLCEVFPFLDGSMAAMDQVFAQAAAQGQTVFSSAGDTGGFCPAGTAVNGVPAGAPDVNYPAASPYVVSVGGTTLLTNADGTYDAETAWLAGGGGPSYFEAPPAWQLDVARTLPDIAMDADPNSGAEVYVNGAPEGVGGTSLSSPLALGAWARLQSAHGNALGFASPELYAAAGSAGYHDIVLGDTGPYPATPGYDLATGNGTIDVAEMIPAF